MIVLLIAACGSSPPATSGDTPEPREDAAQPEAGSVAEDAGTPASDGGAQSSVDPPLGGSSGGSGGAANVNGSVMTAGNVTYRLIVPASPPSPAPLLIVFSGTEGGQAMTSNLLQVAAHTKTSTFIRAVLDGVTYNKNGAAGAVVLDELRAKYDIDNDRTYLLSESAGTRAGLELGFRLRQSHFAAFWANDVNFNDKPGMTAASLGFAPWGQVGPGGNFADANVIVSGMKASGYRLPTPAPYSGPGSGTHGDPNQFIAALQFFPGKSRK